MEILQIILFIITFYFTVLRFITNLKIFKIELNSWYAGLGLQENQLIVLITWLMWFYQIYWWFTKFNLL